MWRSLLPHRRHVPITRTASLSPAPAPDIAWWISTLAALLPLAAAAFILATHWSEIPSTFPVHWDMNGSPNRFASRTPLDVFWPIGLSAFLILWMAVLAPLTARFSPSTITQPALFRMTRNILRAVAWLLSITFAATSLLPLTSDPTRYIPAGIALLLLTFIAVAIYIVVQARRHPELARASDVTDPAHWIAGLFYYNPCDAALLVPKRSGLGYTFNMARPAAWAMMAASSSSRSFHSSSPSPLITISSRRAYNRDMSHWTAANIPDQSGITTIVTGGNSGIGYITALDLARKGARVILACRSLPKAEAAAQQISRTQSPAHESKPAPSTSPRTLASTNSRSDYLASGQPPPPAHQQRRRHGHTQTHRNSRDGFEIAIRHQRPRPLRPHRTAASRPSSAQPPPRRGRRALSLVASITHKSGKIHLNDLQLAGYYTPGKAYGAIQARQPHACLRTRPPPPRRHIPVLSIAAHPGVADTNLFIRDASASQRPMRACVPATHLLVLNSVDRAPSPPSTPPPITAAHPALTTARTASSTRAATLGLAAIAPQAKDEIRRRRPLAKMRSTHRRPSPLKNFRRPRPALILTLPSALPKARSKRSSTLSGFRSRPQGTASVCLRSAKGLAFALRSDRCLRSCLCARPSLIRYPAS